MVVGGLFKFLPLIKVPVVGLGRPGFGEELNNIGVGHLGVGFPVKRKESRITMEQWRNTRCALIVYLAERFNKYFNDCANLK